MKTVQTIINLFGEVETVVTTEPKRHIPRRRSLEPGTESMVILSLGAGVQSSALYLMAAAGELQDKPAYAIFADTGDEPRKVYEYLDYLEQQAGHIIPIQRVSQGHLGKQVIDAVNDVERRVTYPPFYVINRDGSPEHSSADSGGMLWRNCTQDYKIAPIRRETRRLMDDSSFRIVRQWIGISIDEAHRMKDSRVNYIVNEYPLVDAGITRQECNSWLKSHGHPKAPKSACVFCPYRSNAMWLEMKENDPEAFAAACEFDERLRGGRLPGVTGLAYVHRSFTPLREAIENLSDPSQEELAFDGFGNECEGMCGV